MDFQNNKEPVFGKIKRISFFGVSQDPTEVVYPEELSLFCSGIVRMGGIFFRSVHFIKGQQ